MSILGMSISKKLACNLIVLPEVPKSGLGGGLKAYPWMGGGGGAGGASAGMAERTPVNRGAGLLCGPSHPSAPSHHMAPLCCFHSCPGQYHIPQKRRLNIKPIIYLKCIITSHRWSNVLCPFLFFLPVSDTGQMRQRELPARETRQRAWKCQGGALPSLLFKPFIYSGNAFYHP